MEQRLIIDAHQDIAWNIQALNRDYTQSAVETRRIESETNAPALQHEGNALLGWPEYQAGRIAVIFSTLFVTPAKVKHDWDTLFYRDYNEAYRLYREQMNCYRELADRHGDKFRIIGNQADLETVLGDWEDAGLQTHPVGLLPLMEGADGVRSPAELEEWWDGGIRVIGLAWSGTRYSGGTRSPGPLTDDGKALIKVMADIGFTLDISHMDELAARQVLDSYGGPIIASHANAAAVIPNYSGNRHLQDPVIKGVISRGGIIGLVPSCKFLDYSWQPGNPRTSVPFARVADHIDHICQLAGNANHVGFGSDFDGGFGVEAVPAEIDTIADLQKIEPILLSKGYKDEEVDAIFGGNWLRHLRSSLPS